ncbi:uncharacterized protein LOC119720084 [Patiria miniata]|uniref:Uncharacterized protein n=1 Tax=Patiria miniata TaxID=46514 RepID=A0A913Z0W3_PATMI|nr:uncharacterized protein LOC119720084 [Patiria miniata]
MSLDKAKACDILGVPRGASEADIRAAYKRLALKWHPDKHANDDIATEKFQEISAAYKCLTAEDKTEYVLTMEDMFELFAQIFFGSRASYNGYIDTSDDDYDDDSDEDFWESVESKRRTFHRKTTEYSYTANRPTESEASKNAEELMQEEERQKKSREKRKSKKKRQREKKREEKVKQEEEEAKKAEEKRRKAEFLQKAKESAEKARREAEKKQQMSQSTNSQIPHQGTTKSTSTSKVNHDTISNNFNSTKSRTRAPNDVKVKTGTTGSRVRVPSDSVADDDILGWDQHSAFFAGAAATVKRSTTSAPTAAKPEKNKKKGGAKGQNEEAESIDNMDPIVLQSRQTAVKGNEMANLGHYSAAIELFTQAIELDPRDFRFFGNRSFCYDRLEQYESAIKDANRAITLAKDWPKGYFRKGRALAGLKRFGEAETAFEHVLKLDKNCEDAVEELHKVRVYRLMEMGFNRPQSDAAIRQYGSVQAALDALLTNGVEGVINSFPDDVYISDEEDYITETIERSKLDSCNPLNLRSLWVGNLHSTISEKQLRDLFGPFGEIESLRRLPDRFCAFINYKRPEEAARALEQLQGVEVGGRYLLIKFPDNPIVEGQPRTTVLKKTNVAAAAGKQPQPKIAQPVSQTQNDASGNKVTGPVNGNECYFWRTTGCVFGDRCKYKHLKQSKGADLKPWQKVVYDN